jgi:hypothetical protein
MRKPDEIILRYAGTDVAPRAGDHARFVDNPEDFVVDEVVDSQQKLADWGLTEYGVMLRTRQNALVFTRMDDPELEFVSRAK